MKFTRKGYGRIFVSSKDEIQRVKDIIREVDAFELNYLPSDLIAVFSEEYPIMSYTHKFEVEMDKVAVKCWQAGMPILWIDNGHCEVFDEL